MKLYLSGPITGNPDCENLFLDYEKKYLNEGYEVVNPVKLNKTGASWNEAMRRDLHELITCDIIVMLPGWQLSKGANIELNLAINLGLEVKFENKKDYTSSAIIIAAICEIYGITYADLKEQKRHRNIVDARHTFCYLMWKYTRNSTSQIGEYINRDHSTVINSIKRSKNFIETDYQFKAKLDKIIAKIESYVEINHHKAGSHHPEACCTA